MGNGTLGIDEKISSEHLEIFSDTDVGTKTGEFFPYNFGPELPADQTVDDKKSLCFDGVMLENGMELVGAPLLKLVVSSDKPLAQLAVRLCDIRPDGTSALITHGFLNLAMANSFENPKCLSVGKKITVTISLDQIAYFIPEGHRIRVAISTSYWPFLWPSPELVRIKIFSGSLQLPKGVNTKEENNMFDEPVSGDPCDYVIKRPPSSTRHEYVEQRSGSRVIKVKNDTGCIIDNEHGLETESSATEKWSIKQGDPLSATIQTNWFQIIRRENWLVSTRSKLTVKCNIHSFFITASIIAFENDKKVFEKFFDETVERKFI